MSERDMNALISLLEKRLGVQWSDVVQWMRDQNSLDDLERKLVTGRLDEVIQDVTTAAEKFAADLHNAYITAGQHAAEWLDSKLPDTLVRFDVTTPQFVARARANTLDQVAGLTQEARQSMQQALVDARYSGENPRQTAQRIRDGLGLAPNQEQWLANYRTSLEQGDWSKALGYELSSGHGDRTISRLQRDGGALTQTQIDDLSERFRANAITYRAETIARTESLAVAHEGVSDAIGQAVARGDLRADQLQREWNASARRRDSRKDHQQMDGVTAAFGVDYVLPDGTRMRHPGDRRAGAKHCANCGCCESVTIVAA